MHGLIVISFDSCNDRVDITKSPPHIFTLSQPTEKKGNDWEKEKVENSNSLRTIFKLIITIKHYSILPRRYKFQLTYANKLQKD